MFAISRFGTVRPIDTPSNGFLAYEAECSFDTRSRLFVTFRDQNGKQLYRKRVYNQDEGRDMIDSYKRVHNEAIKLWED